MCKVSVIIPTYNRAKYLPDAISSILNQTYQDFEIIIIDDGSIDNSKEIVSDFQKRDRRIKYFYQENKGVACSRNKGCMEAQGEYIAFLDSDDRAVLNRLKEQVKILDKNTKVDLVYGTILAKNIYKNDSKTFGITFPGVIPHKKMFLNLIKYHLFFWTSTVTMRKEIFERYKFDQRMIIGEDFLFFLQASRDFLFYGINKNFAIVSSGHSSLMVKKRNEFNVKIALDILKQEKHNSLPMTRFLYLWAVSNCYLYFAKVNFGNSQLRHLIFLIKAFFYFPLNIYIYKHIIGRIILGKKFNQKYL